MNDENDERELHYRVVDACVFVVFLIVVLLVFPACAKAAPTEPPPPPRPPRPCWGPPPCLSLRPAS
jgi:hypothetical protein